MSLFKYFKVSGDKKAVPPKPKPQKRALADEDEKADAELQKEKKLAKASPAKVSAEPVKAPGKRKKKSALVIESDDDEPVAARSKSPKKAKPEAKKEDPAPPPPAKKKTTAPKTSAKKASPAKKKASPAKKKASPAKKKKREEAPEAEASAPPPPAEKKKKWNPYQAQNRAGPPMKGLKEVPVGAANCLYGKVFLVTGVLDSLERDEAHDLITKYGGEVAKSVVKKLTHLVAGSDPGESKMEKAKARDNVAIVDEDGLFELIRGGKEQAPSKAFLEKRAKQERIAREGREQKPEVVAEIKQVAKEKSAQEMWTTKYAPRTSKALLANPGPIKKVREFLQKWKRPSTSTDLKGFKRAVLISGVPGIGKSTTAALLAREAGYDVLEYNASDARSKKRLKEEGFLEIGGNRSLNEFFAPQDNSAPRNTKTLVIMDEVDGMGGGDRGGNQELIALIKKTRIPVICICNDRQKNSVKTLANYCEDVRFQRPKSQDIASRMRVIMELEGFTDISQPALEQLCSSVNNDIRQVLNLLQMLRLTTTRLDSSAGSFQSEMAEGRHVEQSVFSVTPALLGGGPKPPSRGLEMFFHDYDLMPLMIQENYVRNTPHRPDSVQGLSNAADLISYGDVVKERIMKTQSWGLLPILGMVSSVIPAAEVRGRTSQVSFPAWLGKNSNANKQKRLLKEISVHMSPKTTGANKTEVLVDYIPMLLDPMVEPLKEQGVDGIDSVLKLMDAYNLSKDDWETLYVLAGQEERIQTLDPKLKAAFTRKYNKTAKKPTVAPVTSKKGKGASRIAANDDIFLNKDADEEYGEHEEDSDNEAIGKNDAMIKQKKAKPVAKKAASKSKSAAKKKK